MENDNQDKVKLDILSAEELLHLLKEYVSNESCNVIFVATEKLLNSANDDEELKECLDKVDFVLPGVNVKIEEETDENKESCIGLDVDIINRIVDDEDIDRLSIMLMTDDKDFAELVDLRALEEFKDIEYAGSLVINEETDDDLIINEINGRIPDILISSFDSPRQEKWIIANKSKMNVKLCIALSGDRDDVLFKRGSGTKWLSRIFSYKAL